MTGADLRIGVDFDNTLISYDRVFLSAARQRGLVDPEFTGGKTAIRDHIRRLPGGELLWQKLQGHVYGKGIAAADMFDGLDNFLRRCLKESAPIVIVSHKTEYGHYDPDRVNLREAARDWMAARGFFSDSGYKISQSEVYFESTRAEKVARIAKLGCTYFIDDLEEVLSDPDFPSAVKRILFQTGSTRAQFSTFKVCSSWREVEEQVFDAPH